MNELLCVWLCFYLRIAYYQHICEERLGLPVLPNTSSIQNLFIHLLSCFWELSKRQSRLLASFEWVKANTWLTSYNFPNGLAFLVSPLRPDIWDDHKEPQNVSLVRLHLHFPWLSRDFAVMKTILWWNALWITGDAILNFFALWMRSADTSGSWIKKKNRIYVPST